MSSYKVSNFLGGYNMAVEENSIAPNETQNAQNVDISNGDLRTIGGYAKYVAPAITGGITRLMKFYKNNTTTGAVTSYLLAATASKIYKWDVATTAWVQLATGLTSGDWDYINHQINESDIVIMGNGADAMKKWDGTTFASLSGSPPNMKSIALYKERVWGTGVKAFPNSVYYSDDIAPENWTGGEDASGEIYLPTWDGGVCIGLSCIFDNMVIFKTNNILKIMGTYPAQFEVVPVYSSVGAIAEKSIVSSASRAYFLTKDGWYYYDGTATYPLLDGKLKFTINASYQYLATSIIYKNKLYCAFPEGTSTTNNAVLVYDILKNNAMILRNRSVTDFIEYDDKLLSTNATGYVRLWDSGTTDDGTAIDAFYETPFTDLGMKNATKNADTLYFYASGTGSLKVDLTFDSKVKSKTITLVSTGKMHTIPFNAEGRKFKMKFSNVAGSNFVLSSPELVMEIDED